MTDRKQLQSCAIGAKSMLVSVMGWRTVLISNTEAFGWGGSVLGDMLRDMKQLRARFECCQYCPRMLAGVVRLPFGLPPFFDLRGFASWAFQWRRFDLKFDAKRRKSKKVGHFPFQPHAVALFQYLQQSTRRTWSLDLSPQSITLRRATLG